MKKKKKIYFIVIAFISLSLLISIVFSCFGQNIESMITDIKNKIAMNSGNKVSLVAVGDNIIHENVYTYADKQSGQMGDGKYDFRPCYKNIEKYINDKDLAFINQESILGGDSLGISGYPTFNSPACLADDLIDIGFNLINGATNHSMDMSMNGIINACQTWRQKENILYAGTYDSQSDRDTIRVIEKKGIKLSFLAYTFGVNESSHSTKMKEQLKHYPYILATLDDDTIRQDVAKAKKVSDVIIVSAHWGKEYSDELGEQQKHYAQLFADLGVDLVIGTHSHVIQPMTWLKGNKGNQTLVIYSLGNFLSTMKEVDCQLEGMVSLDFVKKDNSITIENIIYTPLINHYNNHLVTVYAMKDYNDELASQHTILKKEKDIINAFQKKVHQVIDKQYTIDM